MSEHAGVLRLLDDVLRTEVFLHLDQSDLVRMGSTCTMMRSLLHCELQRTSQIKKRVSEYLARRVASRPHVHINTSQFKAPSPNLSTPPACYIHVQVDTPCRACISHTLQTLLASKLDGDTIIHVQDDCNKCPLRDEDLANFGHFPGHLLIPHQQEITNDGLLHLKHMIGIEIGGSHNVNGSSLIKLITDHDLCHVTISGYGKTGVTYENHMRLVKMQQQGLVHVW